MKYWAHKVFTGLAQLIALSILTCAVPAFAQFEVSPDHFDGPATQKKQAAKTSVKKTSAAVSAKSSSKDQAQIAAGSQSQPTRAATGQSQGNRQSAAATNAAGAKPKKRAPATKVVLASTQ